MNTTVNTCLDEESKRYSNRDYNFGFKSYHKIILNELEAYDKNSVLFELGTGNGFLLKELKKRGFSQLLGADGLLNHCKLTKPIHTVQFDFNQTFPIKSKSADVIIILEVLEHLIKFRQAIKELSRIVKKNGTIFISVPNCTYWKHYVNLILKQEMPSDYTGLEGHVIHFSLNQWKQELEKYFQVNVLKYGKVKKLGLPANSFLYYCIFMCKIKK